MTDLAEATEAELAAALAKLRKARRAPAKAARAVSPKARVRDRDFLGWLHDGIPCIACMIDGRPPTVVFHPIEAAHQKHVAGKGGMLGKRPDDGDHTCPLCAWHHRLTNWRRRSLAAAKTLAGKTAAAINLAARRRELAAARAYWRGEKDAHP